jgi:cell division protein FtsB
MSYQEISADPGHDDDTRLDRLLRWSVRVGKTVLVLMVFAAFLKAYEYPLQPQKELREKVEALRRESLALREERDKLSRRLSWVQVDDDYLEDEVRDRLNLHKEGEYVLRFAE